MTDKDIKTLFYAKHAVWVGLVASIIASSKLDFALIDNYLRTFIVIASGLVVVISSILVYLGVKILHKKYHISLFYFSISALTLIQIINSLFYSLNWELVTTISSATVGVFIIVSGISARLLLPYFGKVVQGFFLFSVLSGILILLGIISMVKTSIAFSLFGSIFFATMLFYKYKLFAASIEINSKH